MHDFDNFSRSCWRFAKICFQLYEAFLKIRRSITSNIENFTRSFWRSPRIAFAGVPLKSRDPRLSTSPRTLEHRENGEILKKVRWSTVNIKRSCLQGVVFEGDQTSFWQLLGEFSGVQLEDFATLRRGFEDLGDYLGNFTRRIWRSAWRDWQLCEENLKNCQKSRQLYEGSLEKPALKYREGWHWSQDLPPWAREGGCPPRGGGPDFR